MKARHIAHVESGEDASKIDKDFFVRDDLIGEVAEIIGPAYLFRFRKA